jgi:hypothetical protein
MSRIVLRLTAAVSAVSVILGACASAATPATTPGPLASTSSLPAVTERASSSTPAPARPTRPAPPVLGQFDPASVAGLSLDDTPVVPEVGPAVKDIYTAGLARGNDPYVFSKLGDCMTENPSFLAPFSEGRYDLGEYAYLQDVVEQFAGHPARGGGWTQDSFATTGLAAASGFNIAGPLDPTWANPEWCQAGESPVRCEYRVARPSIAVIMFGTNDVTYTQPDAYDYYLRTLVIETLDHDIVPILSTFPTRPEDPEKSLLLNQIVIRVAQDYGLPLLNLNRALEPLPHHGVDPDDTIHLTVPDDKRVDIFKDPHLEAGFTVRNLVTLQALDAVWKTVR